MGSLRCGINQLVFCLAGCVCLTDRLDHADAEGEGRIASWCGQRWRFGSGLVRGCVWLVVWSFSSLGIAADAESTTKAGADTTLNANAGAAARVWQSHPPTRPLPAASQRPVSDGPDRFVDGSRGDDNAAGTLAAPWKSLQFALKQLQPGDTLYLRGGVHHARPILYRSGTAEQPITIRSYPGELAIVDGGLPEFLNDPATAWEPYEDGADGEYVSTRTYHEFNDRRTPQQFLPAAWEPLLGKEEERPLALGHFADSLLPLHGYRIAVDLRARNELWVGNKLEMRDVGVYAGPGLWFNRDTGRIHIRLAHHQLDGLGTAAYRGETDPRKLPLVISAGFGDDFCRINAIRHVQFQDLVFRGATGSPLLHIYGSENLHFDHCHLYGGFPAVLLNASKDVRFTHCAFRGLAAPWISRAHMKYRGSASYQIILLNNQPRNENIEFGWCEFTDDHDFAYVRHVRNLQFHHNYVDNFNDDGLECGPKLRDHAMYVYQNHFGRILLPFTQHEIEKDESPHDHDPGSGVYLYRNVVDLRGGTYKGPPAEPDPTGSFLRGEGHLLADHGSPIYPVFYVYHNTFLRDTPVFRDGFLFGLGSQGLKHTERDVFNNIFVQTDRVPGLGFVGMKEPAAVREGGNVLWGLEQGPRLDSDWFAKFRTTPLFLASQQRYEPGWTTHDIVADPQFVHLSTDHNAPVDLRLQPDSPATRAGRPIPTDWPDPLRDVNNVLKTPTSGAIPSGAKGWQIGINNRRSIFDR